MGESGNGCRGVVSEGIGGGVVRETW